jgi:hypothetical protein
MIHLLVSGMTARDGCTRHGIGAGLLLLLEICLVLQGLLLVGCHGVLVGGHTGGAGLHAGGWSGDVGVCVLGRLDSGFTVDTVRVSGLGCIEASLVKGLVRMLSNGRWSIKPTWMRFLPSALVTRGWSFGVVKV